MNDALLEDLPQDHKGRETNQQKCRAMKDQSERQLSEAWQDIAGHVNRNDLSSCHHPNFHGALLGILLRVVLRRHHLSSATEKIVMLGNNFFTLYPRRLRVTGLRTSQHEVAKATAETNLLDSYRLTLAGALRVIRRRESSNFAPARRHHNQRSLIAKTVCFAS